MLPRDRMAAAFNRKPVDVAPLRYCSSPRGFYEHGEKLRALFESMPDDFGTDFSAPIPSPPPGAVNEKGEYHEFITDEWGVEWEQLIFQMMGHPYKRPLDDISRLESYKPPPNMDENTAALNRKTISAKKAAGFYTIGYGCGILERMIALRKFEDVLMDLSDDTESINKLADMICDYYTREAQLWLNAGADCILFGDDYGTQNGLLFSPDFWRVFFKPRLKRMLAPVKASGKKAIFHSCGQVGAILDDLKEIGADAIWPQLSLYDQKELGARCRNIGLSVEIHIDRAGVMTNGTPDDVRAAVELAVEAFRPLDGGGWFYIEVDNGFPFDNIEALVTAVKNLRTGRDANEQKR